MKFIFLIAVLLVGCKNAEPPIVIKLIRRDGTEVFCRTEKDFANCKPWRVFMSCTGGSSYDCSLEQGTVQ